MPTRRAPRKNRAVVINGVFSSHRLPETAIKIINKTANI
jgi:hypothetical protein